jgi:ABC-2 type transport system permease protein
LFAWLAASGAAKSWTGCSGMWTQVLAIAWAQMRISRNHLPRTNVGSVLGWLVSLLWYGLYAAGAAGLAIALPAVPVSDLRRFLPAGLLVVFLFWQLVPLFTLSSGWSLQLNKLRVYPVPNQALFGIEVLLRVTSAPEMIIVLLGALVGLLRHPDVPLLQPLFLLLYIPLNLFLSLAIRELFLHAFERNRFRELFAILLISVGVLPQILLHTALGQTLKPYLWAIARGKPTPWYEVARLSLAAFSTERFLLLLVWIFAAYWLARRQFEKSLIEEDTFSPARPVRAAAAGGRPARWNPLESLLHLSSRLLDDPTGALVEKELRSLLRMPRFRVLFGMACLFSGVMLVAVTFGDAGRHAFMRANLLAIMNLYGLLILGQALLLNVFGFDRAAAQIYFVAPIPFKSVMKAKNLAAITFILLQGLAALLVASLLRVSITLGGVVDAGAATAVVAVFLLSVGNLISTAIPQPYDPRQTVRRQAGVKMQLWFLLCSLGMFLLLSFAFLAQWALDSHRALLGVLALEFAIGLIFYRIALDSAVERGLRERERIIDTLSKGASPIGLGT